MRNLDEVFEEALLDDYGGVLDDKGVEARIVLTVKIVRDRESGKVEILNTAKGGEYYKEITEDEYKIFTEKGWRYGVYVVYLSNCRLKLDMLEVRINEHMNDKVRNTIDALQERRKTILNNYTKIKIKLNQTQDEQLH